MGPTNGVFQRTFIISKILVIVHRRKILQISENMHEVCVTCFCLFACLLVTDRFEKYSD